MPQPPEPYSFGILEIRRAGVVNESSVWIIDHIDLKEKI